MATVGPGELPVGPGELADLGEAVCDTDELELRFRFALSQMKAAQAKHPPITTQELMMMTKAIFAPVLIPGGLGGTG